MRNLSKNEDSQKNGNQNQSSRNLSSSTDGPEIGIAHFSFLSNLKANNKNNIPSKTDFVNTKIFSKENVIENPGEIKTWPNQPADKFPQIPERTRNQEFLSLLGNENIIKNNLSENNSVINGKWTKVIYLKKGMEIAVADIKRWEKIVSIKKTGVKHVYDLQIANTHNFVAGHFVNQKTGKALSAKDEEAIGKLFADLFSSEGNIGKQNSHNQKTSGYISPVNKFVELINSHVFDAKIIAKYKRSIENIDRTVNSKNETETGMLTTAATERSVKNEEKGASVKFEDLENLEFGGIIAHNTYISGNVGIGTTTPAEKLDIAGTAQMTGFKMPTGAAAGYVLTSDALGVGTWSVLPTSAPTNAGNDSLGRNCSLF